jgi:Kef-type K+ transport system membrane component KefB
MVVDIAIAVVLAVLILVLTAGLGVVAILVGIVALVCAISFGARAIARRWRGQAARRVRGARRR